MKNTICSQLGITYPIIQAPMAGVSTVAMAAAVSNAGALGSIALGAVNAAQAALLLTEIKSLTSKPYSVNLFCHEPAQTDAQREREWLKHLTPYFKEFDAAPPGTLSEIYTSFVENKEMLDVLLAARPPVVSFHFGLPPASFIKALKEAGCILMASATTLEEARLIEEAGIDTIVAQGYEAGGHRGVFNPAKEDAAIGTFALVQLLSNHTRLPVIAAGGIMSGQAINPAMILGAAGVQLGTAFILCPESAASASYRQLIKSDRAQKTGVAASISGRPARGLVNRYFDDIGKTGHPPLPAYPIAYDAAKKLNAAAQAKGNQDFSVNWAGQGAPLARTMPAAELIRTLVQEMNM